MANSSDSGAKVQYLTVDENAEGQRIDNFLMARLKGVPKSWVYRVLRKGEVRVNKGRAKPTRKLEIGDEVRVPPVRRSDDKALIPGAGMQQAITDNILYEDDLLLIVNKPSGMAVHGGSGVSHGVIEALRAARPEAKFLELAHRLDRDTSGCLMLAKKRSALKELQRLQVTNQVDKRYQALLDGRWRKGKQTVDVPLQKNTLKSGERMVRVDPEGKRRSPISRCCSISAHRPWLRPNWKRVGRIKSVCMRNMLARPLSAITNTKHLKPWLTGMSRAQNGCFYMLGV